VGGLTFFTQRPQDADNFKLFVRQGAAGHDRVLVDPTEASGTNGHVSLDWWRTSPDGRHRPARRPLPCGEDGGTAAGGDEFRQTHPAARRL
jgi:hypothetical protein